MGCLVFSYLLLGAKTTGRSLSCVVASRRGGRLFDFGTGTRRVHGPTRHGVPAIRETPTKTAMHDIVIIANPQAPNRNEKAISSSEPRVHASYAIANISRDAVIARTPSEHSTTPPTIIPHSPRNYEALVSKLFRLCYLVGGQVRNLPRTHLSQTRPLIRLPLDRDGLSCSRRTFDR